MTIDDYLVSLSETINRRNFLKNIGITALGTAVGAKSIQALHKIAEPHIFKDNPFNPTEIERLKPTQPFKNPQKTLEDDYPFVDIKGNPRMHTKRFVYSPGGDQGLGGDHEIIFRTNIADKYDALMYEVKKMELKVSKMPDGLSKRAFIKKIERYKRIAGRFKNDRG